MLIKKIEQSKQREALELVLAIFMQYEAVYTKQADSARGTTGKE